MGLKRVTAPAESPVTLDEAKAHLRVDFDDDNDMIESFIDAAIDELEGPGGYLGRVLIDQTWDLYIDRFPCPRHGIPWKQPYTVGEIEIPLPPLIEVIGIYYLDANAEEQEFPTSSYSVDVASEPGRVVPVLGGSWPTIEPAANSIRIRFRAGYLDQGVSPPVENVPSTVKAAILLFVGDLYANRESIVVGQTAIAIPGIVDRLLRRKRFYLGMA